MATMCKCTSDFEMLMCEWMRAARYADRARGRVSASHVTVAT